jgi:hypothetical protein
VNLLFFEIIPFAYKKGDVVFVRILLRLPLQRSSGFIFTYSFLTGKKVNKGKQKDYLNEALNFGL